MKANKTQENFVDDLKQALKLIEAKNEKEHDKDKREMYRKLIEKINKFLNNNKKNENENVSELIKEFKDILSIWLDKENGKSVDRNEIFFDLPKRFEAAYHDDMAALNVI